MPRFVILEHDHPSLHWDFMLERDGLLKTWRLPAPPTEQPRTALAIGDHRLAYLDYEGPVSGDRGTVNRWDAGTYETLADTGQTWTIRLRGNRWLGIVELAQATVADWICTFEPEVGLPETSKAQGRPSLDF